MRLSPFVRDAAERAAKTMGGGFATYLFEGELGLSHLPLPVRALYYAAGTAAFSWLASLVSRRLGRPGTASALRVVEYER